MRRRARVRPTFGPSDVLGDDRPGIPGAQAELAGRYDCWLDLQDEAPPALRGVLFGDPVADGRGERPGGMLPDFTAGVLAPMAQGKLNLARSYPAPGQARDVSQPGPKAVASRGAT
jgi:hypothetical protein